MGDSDETEDGSGLAFARTAAATATDPSPPAPFPVTDWARYTIVRLLGQGGMGAVYQARDLRLERVVALKFILGGDPRLTTRLLQEARAQARVDHPNVWVVA
jgi:serine/threonine protein kinase